ncbi:MAG TPA: hypothetical protein VGH28_33290 [Polyangiaceae bacterium]
MKNTILMIIGALVLCSGCHAAHVYVEPTHTTAVEVDLHHHHHHHHHRSVIVVP